MAVDLTLAKQHLRLDTNDEDTLVTAYLIAAQAWVENYTGKLMTRRDVEQEESGFSSCMRLTYGPKADDVIISYVDPDGTVKSIADARQILGRLFPASSWPSIMTDTPVVISYNAGFDETPGDLDAAVLLMLGDFYANRETAGASPATAAAVEALCRPYRPVLV